MGIWIKTQNGFLEFCKTVIIRNFDGGVAGIQTFDSDAIERRTLGRYSEKRAKEIMQMIHKHINKLEYFRATGNTYASVPAVFEMPEQ